MWCGATAGQHAVPVLGERADGGGRGRGALSRHPVGRGARAARRADRSGALQHRRALRAAAVHARLRRELLRLALDRAGTPRPLATAINELKRKASSLKDIQ